MKKNFTPISRIIVLTMAFIVSGIVFFVVPNTIQASCQSPAYCDAAPGTCSTTCNGGQTCVIGGTQCTDIVQPDGSIFRDCYCGNVTWTSCCTPAGGSTNCTCSSTGSGCSGNGTACGSTLYPGVCQCQTTGGGGGPLDGGTDPGGSCNPVCNPPYCGQPNGCGGFCGTSDVYGGCGAAPNQCGGTSTCGIACPATDAGTPTAVTITAPPNGGDAIPVGGSITVSWTNTSPLSDFYQVEVYNAFNPNCSSAGAYCNTAYSGTSLSYPIVNGVYFYTARVRATNNSCTPATNSTWATVTFGIAGTISGNFRLDPTQTAVLSGNSCVGGGSATLLGAGSSLTSVGIDGLTRNATIVGSTYSIYTYYWNPGNNTLTLNPGTAPNGEPYICSCPSGCVYSGINSPQSNVDFYIAQNNLINGGWWQVIGGNIYAAQSSGLAVRSYIPTFYCTLPICKPYILGRDLANKTDSAGIAVTGGGAVDSTKDPGNSTSNVTQRGTQTIASGVTTTKIKESYDYFLREFSLGLNPSDDFSSTAGDAQKPTNPPADGKNAYYHNGDMTIQNLWQVNSGEKIVVFVDGDLTLTDPGNIIRLTGVQSGGFLAFIVKGDIIIDTSVGNSNLNAAAINVEGVFISDGTLRIPGAGTTAGGDKWLLMAGTYVGWTNVEIERDFDDGGTRKAENNNKPVTQIIFRPDFLLNIPEVMTRSSYIWQETN